MKKIKSYGEKDGNGLSLKRIYHNSILKNYKYNLKKGDVYI